MQYVRTPFSEDEYEALALLADEDLRVVTAEARYLVREALRRAGLLTTTGAVRGIVQDDDDEDDEEDDDDGPV